MSDKAQNATENEDWQLGMYVEWRPKYKQVACVNCSGNGKVGGGLGDLDGPRDCNVCYGRGLTSVRPKSSPPDIPADILEHMRRAWWDYHNNN